MDEMTSKRAWSALVALSVVLGVAAVAAPASAVPEIHWDGTRGLDSVVECDAGQDPYLHWILTPGGRADVSAATLHVDGESYTGFRPGGGGGAFHFLTPDVDPDEIGSAFATFTGSIGHNALLTISDGCVGEDEPSS